MNLQEIPFIKELTFKTSRSSGKGGQNVNKVESRVELNFHLQGSDLLKEDQKQQIAKRLAKRINNEGVLQVVVEEERSQHRNKEIAIQRFYELIEKALKKRKKRKPTKPGKAAREKRLQIKKEQGEKKQRRSDDKVL